jgi:chorismate mutase
MSPDKEASKRILQDQSHEIDDMDEELINLLGRRMKIADRIGEYKKHNNIAIYQNRRWNEILEKAIENGRNRGLSEEFVSIILKAIHDESINHQEEILKK